MAHVLPSKVRISHAVNFYLYSISGHKSSVQSHLNYLVIVSPPIPVSASHPSATVRNIAARSGPTADITKITVFDPDNKSLAFTRTFSEGVKAIFFEWGQIFILTNDGKVKKKTEIFNNQELKL